MAVSCTYMLNLCCDRCALPRAVTSRTSFEIIKKRRTNNQTYRCHACIRVQADTASIEEAANEMTEFPVTHSYSAEAEEKDQIKYTNAVLLYSLLLAAGEQWTDRTIAPISAQIGNLAPTIDLTTAVYLQLHKENLISPVLPPSRLGLPTIGHDNYFSFHPHNVKWVLDATLNTDKFLIARLESEIKNFDPSCATDLWYAVAEAECERYFGELCARYRFKNELLYSEKVGAAIRYCLDRLSLPQVWNILWSTMRTVAALVQEETYSHPHVYNMIPTIITRDIDRRLANNQQIRPWGRLQPHRESVLTSVLFDKVFRNGTEAFEQVNGKNSSHYI
ncbi:MAG: hypothetical protein C0490_22065 [Marivirga sp.]|nr:hypothetical protein [Marivirga sp.]